jgi:hypothetical protein
MKKYRTTLKMTVTREVEVEVDCTFYPGEPPVYYYRNGDGYPGSDDELCVENVRVAPSGIDLELCKDEMKELRDLLDKELREEA